MSVRAAPVQVGRLELVDRFRPPARPYTVVSTCLFRLPTPYAPHPRYVRGLVDLAAWCARERRHLRVYLHDAAAEPALVRALDANPWVQRVDVRTHGASPFLLASLRLLPLARRHAAGATRVVVSDVDLPHASRGQRELRATLAAGEAVTLLTRAGYRFKWGPGEPLAAEGAIDAFWAQHGAPVLDAETLRDRVEAAIARPPRGWFERFDRPEVRALLARKRGPGALGDGGIHYGFDEYLVNRVLVPLYLERFPCQVVVYRTPGYPASLRRDPLRAEKAAQDAWLAEHGRVVGTDGTEPGPPPVPWDRLAASWRAARAAAPEVPERLRFEVRDNPGAARALRSANAGRRPR